MMPRYLERLAATAQNANPRIHPMPRPLFAPLPAYLTPPMELSEEVEPAGQQPRPAAPDRQRLVETTESLPDARKIEETAGPPFFERERREEAPLIAPEIPTTPATTTLPQPLDAHTSRVAPETVEAKTAAPEPVNSEALVVKRFGAEAKRAAIPPGSSGSVRRIDLVRTLARHTNAARPEPDEINIHIGRVEVTAVQAPKPAEMPRPARKTPSLDEYLKRGRR